MPWRKTFSLKLIGFVCILYVAQSYALNSKCLCCLTTQKQSRHFRELTTAQEILAGSDFCGVDFSVPTAASTASSTLEDWRSFFPAALPILGLGLWNLPLSNGAGRRVLCWFSCCELCLLGETKNSIYDNCVSLIYILQIPHHARVPVSSEIYAHSLSLNRKNKRASKKQKQINFRYLIGNYYSNYLMTEHSWEFFFSITNEIMWYLVSTVNHYGVNYFWSIFLWLRFKDQYATFHTQSYMQLAFPNHPFSLQPLVPLWKVALE